MLSFLLLILSVYYLKVNVSFKTSIKPGLILIQFVTDLLVQDGIEAAQNTKFELKIESKYSISVLSCKKTSLKMS